jgi:thiamine-phosphate pyrophosphorylase
MLSKLQYISQGNSIKEQYENIHRVLDAGCTWIQLRVKDESFDDLITLAEKTQKLCARYRATFIVNDYVKVAERVNAHGVHLGLNDMPVAEARKILGNTKIIGGTANTLNDVIKRYNEKCNYIGLGPLRFTSTKKKLSPILGKEGYKFILNQLNKLGINTPIYAIGGITINDVPDLINSGVYGVAVSSALTQEKDITNTVNEFYSVLNRMIKTEKV